MPDLDSDEEEIRRSNVKHELKEIFMRYRENNCDKFGNIIENNLSVKQVKAIKELKTKMSNEGLVCYKTDKTGKLVIDTVDNYAMKMEKHIKNDIEVTEKKVKTIENKLNEHMEHWVGITRAGENTGQTRRIKSNLKTKENQLPVLSGTSKDHKISKNKKEGPELRPIMGANVGPNVGASNFVSQIIRKIADLEDEGFVCKSTEEMLHTFDNFNKSRNLGNSGKRNLIIGSMDIEKWYPNTIPRPTAKRINEMYIKSKLEIKGVDYEKVAKYLGKFLTREEILQENMEEILYIKEGKMKERKKDKSPDTKKANGRGGCNKKNKNINGKNKVTKKVNVENKRKTKKNENGNKNKNKNKVVILKPKREPTEEEKRKMMGKAIEVLIVATTTNHVYKFGKKFRIQAEGGPIGLSCTGEMAECFMTDWDKKLMKKLKNVGIELDVYTRFKDDINVVTEALAKGSKLVEGKLVIDEEKKQLDESKSDSKITMEIIREIAESIDPMIKLTVDTPCNYEGGAIPILDLEVSINPEENNRIDYQFFEKPTKSDKVLLANAAMSAKAMRTILTQECLRRLRNTNVQLGEEVQKKHLNNYMLKLKNSGHSLKYRKEILDSALNGFEKMLIEDRNGTKPLFRNRNWNLNERNDLKNRKKTNWFNNHKKKLENKSEIVYKSVLFVPPTPRGELAKQLKQREAELNKNSIERIKIVEKSGLKMEDNLVKKDPFPDEKCVGIRLEKCMVCTSAGNSNPKISCRKNNVGYSLQCHTCEERNLEQVYEGETSRSAWLRGAEHLMGYKNKDPKNVIFKHKQSDHKNEEMVMKMTVRNSFKDALTRQSNEAVRINRRENKTLLNSKCEMNHPPVARITVEKKQGHAQPQLVGEGNQKISIRFRNRSQQPQQMAANQTSTSSDQGN